jgi:hypothetical protein
MGSITVAQTPLTNGHTTYGKIAIGSIVNEEQKEANAISKLTPGQDIALKTFRILIADLCQQFKGGHPGYVSCFTGLANSKLTFYKWCNWYGGYRDRTLEICHAICSSYSRLLQPRSFRSIQRPYLSISIYISSFDRLQSNDL